MELDVFGVQVLGLGALGSESRAWGFKFCLGIVKQWSNYGIYQHEPYLAV